jgi:hypothetical protein
MLREKPDLVPAGNGIAPHGSDVLSRTLLSIQSKEKVGIE